MFNLSIDWERASALVISVLERTMKRTATILFLLSFSGLASADVLDTPSFIVNIEVRCPEGNVACDDVIYSGKSKKSGKSITLKGSTWHTLCADRVTPCRFIGYRFKSGKTTYSITQEGDLTVTQGNKVLVDEHSEWK